MLELSIHRICEPPLAAEKMQKQKKSKKTAAGPKNHPPGNGKAPNSKKHP